MAHGDSTWSFVYRDLIGPLRNDYRCVAADHLGFGLSDAPGGWTYLPQDHAVNLAALIEELGPKVALRKKELRRWESAFPTAWTLRLSAVGHFVREEAPDELAQAVGRFLEEIPPTMRKPGA